MSDDAPRKPPSNRYKRPTLRLVAVTRSISHQVRRTRPGGIPHVLAVGLPAPPALADELWTRAEGLEAAFAGHLHHTGQLVEAQAGVTDNIPVLFAWVRETRRWLDLFASTAPAETAAAARLARRALRGSRPVHAALVRQLHALLPLLAQPELANAQPDAWTEHARLGPGLLDAAIARQQTVDAAVIDRASAPSGPARTAHITWLRNVERRWNLAVDRSEGEVLALWWDELEDGEG